MDDEKRLKELEDYVQFDKIVFFLSTVIAIPCLVKKVLSIEEVFGLYALLWGLSGGPARIIIETWVDKKSESKAKVRAIYIGWYVILALCFYVMR